MSTVTLKPGEKIYQESQIDELFKLLEDSQTAETNAKQTVHDQKVLIKHSIKVFETIQVLFPGISQGKFGGGDILSIGKKLKENPTFLNDIKKLSELIEGYKKLNPNQLQVLK